MKTAGKLAFPIPDMMPMAGRFGNIKDLARSSLFGAGVTGLLTTLNTGNPLAGLTVAGADIYSWSPIKVNCCRGYNNNSYNSISKYKCKWKYNR